MSTLPVGGIPPKRRLPEWLWPTTADPGMRHPNLVRTGLALIFFYLAMMFLPDTVYSIARFIVHPLGLLWVGLAMTKMTRRFRFTLPFICLLLLQVWMVISMIFAEQFVPKPHVTGEYLWFPIEIGMVYLVTLELGNLMPGSMRYVINWLLVLCTVSSAIAILQAAHFPPAIRIADFYVYRSIEGWDNVAGVRASGLSNNPNSNLMSLLVAASLIAYKSARRQLRWHDYVMWGLFISASFVAQHRSSMPLVGLTFLVTTLVMFRRRPIAMGAVFAVVLMLFTVSATVLKHNFAYTFETTWSSTTPQLRSRLDEEKVAYAYFEKYPLTGIGPSPAPLAVGMPMGDYDLKVENLYYAFLLTLGVPGLILLLAMYGGALVLSVAQSLNKRQSPETRVLMLAGALGATNLLWNGNVAVNITQFHIMYPYMVLLALAQLVAARPSESGRAKVSPYLQLSERPTSPLIRY